MTQNANTMRWQKYTNWSIIWGRLVAFWSCICFSVSKVIEKKRWEKPLWLKGTITDLALTCCVTRQSTDVSETTVPLAEHMNYNCSLVEVVGIFHLSLAKTFRTQRTICVGYITTNCQQVWEKQDLVNSNFPFDNNSALFSEMNHATHLETTEQWVIFLSGWLRTKKPVVVMTTAGKVSLCSRKISYMWLKSPLPARLPPTAGNMRSIQTSHGGLVALKALSAWKWMKPRKHCA